MARLPRFCAPGNLHVAAFERMRARSASGLDPQISPRNAELQVARVAKARGLDENQLRALVKANTDERGWGVFGEVGVNVLLLNIALDKIPSHVPSENHVAQQGG